MKRPFVAVAGGPLVICDDGHDESSDNVFGKASGEESPAEPESPQCFGAEEASEALAEMDRAEVVAGCMMIALSEQLEGAEAAVMKASDALAKAAHFLDQNKPAAGATSAAPKSLGKLVQRTKIAEVRLVKL